MTEPFGFLVTDKPAGMTSHDVVAKIRRATKVKRVGHAGTLDPMATGVLIVCMGQATRLSEYVMHQDKVYNALIRLGVETDTYDADGKVIATNDVAHLSLQTVEETLKTFVGDIEQVPPMYSAIKQGGKKLYELARQGKDVERTARRVHIKALILGEYALPDIEVTVFCSAGTYVRSIAHDLGEKLGVGAHLTALHRKRSGAGSDDNSVELQTILDAAADGSGNWQKYLQPVDEMLPFGTLPVSAAQADYILHGRTIPCLESVENGQLKLTSHPKGGFIGIVQAENGVWQPIKVFPPEE